MNVGEGIVDVLSVVGRIIRRFRTEGDQKVVPRDGKLFEVKRKPGGGKEVSTEDHIVIGYL